MRLVPTTARVFGINRRGQQVAKQGARLSLEGVLPHLCGTIRTHYDVREEFTLDTLDQDWTKTGTRRR